MKVGIYTFERFLGRKNLGSSRIRGTWIANNWEEAELYCYGAKYDVIIYQKAYDVEHARLFKGIKIFDLCDADFLHFGYRTIEMINECDAVTTSTEVLAEQLRKFTDKPVLCIPDRIDLEEASIGFKKHTIPAQIVGWMGYSHNFDVLKSAITELKRKKIQDLVVISDKPFFSTQTSDGINIINKKHKWEHVYGDLLDIDIFINPTFNKGRWKYKSNNKTILAWSLGIPVATNSKELERFLNPDERNKEAKLRRAEVEKDWDIKLSVIQYKELIKTLT